MTHVLITMVLILACVLCPEHAHAQDTNTELREKAFKLLESSAGQLSTLQSAENRARLGANIADSLWNHDEKRARALLALVQDDIRAGLTNRDLEDPQDLHTLKVFLKLRLDTVERMAKHDAELALAFLKATEFTSDDPLPSEIAESERGFEIRLAKLIANTNPDAALKLGRRSLAQGFSEDLLHLLSQLNRKHKEQALILYKEVVNKLRDADLTQDWNAKHFARNLVYAFKPPALNDPTFRELVGIFVSRALAEGCGSKATISDHTASYCREVVSLMPQMERIDSRVTQLQHWVGDRDVPNVPAEAVHEFYELATNGTVEDLLALAPKYPHMQQDIYWEAVRRANLAGDFEQVRKILTDHIADSDEKQAKLAAMDRRINPTPVDDKKFAEIQSTISEIPRVAPRVGYLLSQAEYFARYDRETASKLLKQAADMAATIKPGSDQTYSQIGIAMVYCSNKNDRGFAIMESLMPKINELVDAAIKLDGYETRYVRDGEWDMSANGSVGDILTRLSQNAGTFAWCDFDRAVSLSAQFYRTEIRLMAQVKLAQAVLAGPPKRAPVEDLMY